VQAIAYANLGQVDTALQTAALSLQTAPETQKEAIEQLIAQLQGQFIPAETPQQP